MKQNNNGVICYDLLLVPKEVELGKLLEIQKVHKYIFYDSYEALKLGSSRAYPYYIKTGRIPKYAIDVNSVEGKKLYAELKLKLKDENTGTKD